MEIASELPYSMELTALSRILEQRGAALAHVHLEVNRDPDPGPLVAEAGLSEALARSLERRGIERLYRFQYESFEAALSGNDIVIVSGTGTGKTEAFMLPVLESIIREGAGARRPYAILVYPTKALARDQYIRIKAFAEGLLGVSVRVLDGDTPRGERQEIYSSPPHILITNPDMIHVGLARSDRFRRLVRSARFVILDELHVYKGVFGSHVRWVLYRLEQELDEPPVYIGAGATIGNPESLGEKLFGRSVRVVEGPLKRRGVILHGFIDAGRTSRWSIAATTIAVLARQGLKVLGFVDSQQMAELIARIAARSMGVRVGVHRAGLLPEERRRVEEEFRDGTLNAVVATPTMELGIDLGDLDAVVMAHLPKSFSSYVQRSGRAGRRDKPGLSLTVMADDPIEAYFLRSPDRFFKQRPEPSYVEPGNREVARVHLVGLLLQRGIVRVDSLPRELQAVLSEVEALNIAVRARGKLFADFKRARDYLEAHMSLRSSGPIVKIVEAGSERVIGQRELPQALYNLHPGAVYYHAGRPYLSVGLSVEAGRATVRRLQSINYYTKPLYDVEVLVIRPLEERRVPPLTLVYGDVHIEIVVRGYQVREEYSGALIHEHEFDEPLKWDYWTKGVATRYPNPGISDAVSLLSGYHALEHALIAAARPVVGASDTDLGGVSYPSGHIVIYDSAPGGHGASRLVFDRFESVMDVAENILSGCDCEDGCPRCVYSPYCGVNNRFISRNAAKKVLEYTLRASSSGRVLRLEAPQGKGLA